MFAYLLAAIVTLLVTPQVGFAPADIKVRVRIEPNPNNRYYQVIVTGPDYYAESEWPLEGAESPPTQPEKWYKGLPSGEYDVYAIVYQLDNGKFHTYTTKKTVIIAGRQ